MRRKHLTAYICIKKIATLGKVSIGASVSANAVHSPVTNPLFDTASNGDRCVFLKYSISLTEAAVSLLKH